MISRRFLAEFFDVFVCCFRLEQRVIDQAGPFSCGCGLAEYESDARGARIDNAVHALRAAMEALGRAAAHRSLLRAAVAIEPRDDRIRDLLNQRLVIAVIHHGTILTEKVSHKGTKEDTKALTRFRIFFVS